MKKRLSILLALIMAIVMIACEPTRDTTNDEILRKIEQLESQLENQSAKNSELEEKLKEQSDKSSVLEELLRQNQEDREFLEKRLENLTGKAIEFTAEKAIYGPREGEELYANFMNNDIEHFENTFTLFENYYLNEFKPKIDYDFYILDPGDTQAGEPVPSRHKGFSILVEELTDVPVNPMIYESVCIYDEVLGDSTIFEKEGYFGGHISSFELYLYLAPLPKDFVKDPKNLHGEIWLEFGNNAKMYWSVLNKYINIYVGNTCIGTSYYLTSSYISHTWFEKFFINHIY